MLRDSVGWPKEAPRVFHASVATGLSRLPQNAKCVGRIAFCGQKQDPHSFSPPTNPLLLEFQSPHPGCVLFVPFLLVLALFVGPGAPYMRFRHPFRPFSRESGHPGCLRMVLLKDCPALFQQGFGGSSPPVRTAGLIPAAAVYAPSMPTLAPLANRVNPSKSGSIRTS